MSNQFTAVFCLFIIYYSDYPYCNYPLGVESGAIPDEQITATKSHAETAAPKYARLNTKDGAGAWCHPYIDREDDQQYLQVKYHLDGLRASLNVCFHNISNLTLTGGPRYMILIIPFEFIKYLKENFRSN